MFEIKRVKDALREIGVVGINVCEVRRHGRQGGTMLTGYTGTIRWVCCPRYNSISCSVTIMWIKTAETIHRATVTGQEGGIASSSSILWRM